MDIEKMLADLHRQNQETAKCLVEISKGMKKLSDFLQSINEVTFINDYLIEYILNEKFNLPMEEISQLRDKAKESHRKAIDKIREKR